MFHELKEKKWLETPKGVALAIGFFDYGEDYHLQWVCFVESTGECWTFENTKIRLAENYSMSRAYEKELLLEEEAK